MGITTQNPSASAAAIKKPLDDDATYVVRWIGKEEPPAADINWQTGTQTYQNLLAGGVAAPLTNVNPSGVAPSRFAGDFRCMRIFGSVYGYTGAPLIDLPDNAFTLSMFVRPMPGENGSVGDGLLIGRSSVVSPRRPSTSKADWDFAVYTLSSTTSSENTVAFGAFLRTSAQPVNGTEIKNDVATAQMNTALQFGAWNHIIVRYDGAALNVLANGVGNSGACTGTTTKSGTAANRRWGIGRMDAAGDTTKAYGLTGEYGPIDLFNTALSWGQCRKIGRSFLEG